MEYAPKAFFLFGDGGLKVELDITRAAGYMEPVDVENGEYEAVFDDTGRCYRFWTEGETTRLEPTEQVDVDALRERLRVLASEGHLEIDGADAEDPLSVATAISRWEWEHMAPVAGMAEPPSPRESATSCSVRPHRRGRRAACPVVSPRNRKRCPSVRQPRADSTL